MTDSWTFDGIPRIRSVLVRWFGSPKDQAEADRYTAAAAELLNAMKDHVREGFRTGKYRE